MLGIECWIRRSRRVLLEFVEMEARCPALVGLDATRSEGPATWRVLDEMVARWVRTSVTMHVINKVTSLPCTTLRPLYAGAECHCTAQLLRSFRDLHLLHRNAQHSQVTLRGPSTSVLTYLMVVVVLWGPVVVVVGVVSWALSFTGRIGWATR